VVFLLQKQTKSGRAYELAGYLGVQLVQTPEKDRLGIYRQVSSFQRHRPLTEFERGKKKWPGIALVARPKVNPEERGV